MAFLLCGLALLGGVRLQAQAQLTLAQQAADAARRAQPYSAHLRRAEQADQARDHQLACRECLAAVNAAGSDTLIPAAAWLRLARLALYENRNEERAGFYSARIRPAELSAPQRQALERLHLRLSLASGQAKVFREGREGPVPSTVRCFEISAARVWVGTYQGLFSYAKAGTRWQEVQAFAGAEPRKVEALRWAGGRLYAGTLGHGLWRQEAGEGQAARNLTMLLADPPRGFWVGTYGDGLYYWDRQASRLSHFSRRGGQLGDDWVLCAVRAESGTYFGTLGGGLARCVQGAWQVLSFLDEVLAADIPALSYAAPCLFLGSLGAGVSVLTEGRL